VNFIEDLITDESVIHFKNGDMVTGAKGVSDLIQRCCEEYNAGYMEGMKQAIGKGAIIGALGVCAVIGISKVIKHRKKTQK